MVFKKAKRLTFAKNDKLRDAGAKVSISPQNFRRYLRAKTDFLYFCRKFVKIHSLDEGIINFVPRKFQEEIYNAMEEERFLIAKIPRRYGKTAIVIAYFLWKVIFNDQILVGIFADKAITAKKILGMIQLSYENLPMWMQQGVKEWSKEKIILENGSQIDCGATTGNSGRSGGYNYLLLDEFAFVPVNLQEDFYRAVYPVITSGAKTKVFIISTPKGMNLYYKIWKDAERKKNDFRAIEVHWSALPGRDEKWKQKQVSNMGQDSFDQEFGCEFLGSAGITLVSSSKLKNIPFTDPVRKVGDLEIFIEPQEGHTYVLPADTAQGVGLDYSAFSIIDITTMPYVQVAKYKNNTISQLDYPIEIYRAGKLYNNAYVFIEINDGKQVGDLLYSELEYENQLFTYRRHQSIGQKVSLEYLKGGNPGLQMTAKVKKVATSNLKPMIENDQLIISDFDTLLELNSFIQIRNAWMAEAGAHDDLVMGLCLFAWLAIQPFFKELCNQNIREKLKAEKNRSQESQVDAPFMQNGINDQSEYEVFDNAVWHTIGSDKEHPVERAWREAGVHRKDRGIS